MIIFLNSWCFGEDTLKVSLPSFPPFYDNEHPSKGVISKIYSTIEEKLDLKVEIIKLPYARILKNLKNGDLDAALIFKNKKIANDIKYVAKLSESQILIWVKRGKQLKDYKSLHHLQIATIRAASFHDRFDNDEKIFKIPVRNYVQALKMLNKNRVDGIIGSKSGVLHSARISNINLDEFPPPLLLGTKEWWLHISNKSKKLKMSNKLKDIINSLYRKNLVFKVFQQEYLKQKL